MEQEGAYRERLNAAIEHANVDYKALAAALGTSAQAMYAVTKEPGTGGRSTKALSAENNARAAKYLGVSCFWLATGEGQMLEPPPWPFPTIQREDFDSLTPAQKASVEGRLHEAIIAARQFNDAEAKDVAALWRAFTSARPLRRRMAMEAAAVALGLQPAPPKAAPKAGQKKPRVSGHA